MAHFSQEFLQAKIRKNSIGIYPQTRVITQQKHTRAPCDAS